MSVAAFDVNNREPDLADVYDDIESRIAELTLYRTRAAKAYRLMSAKGKKSLAGQEIEYLQTMIQGRILALTAELMRLRQAED